MTAPTSTRDWMNVRREQAEKARDFPTNTCPPSRHVQMMADELAEGRIPIVMQEDPEHAAASIYGVLAALWELRSETAPAERAESAGDERGPGPT